MSQKGLAYTSMLADRPNNFGIGASDYVPTPTGLRVSNNLNDYVSNFGRYTDMNGVTTGNMPSKAAFDAVDVTKAPAVFNEKGLFDWSVNEAGKESPNRNRSAEENLDLFKRMRIGEFKNGEKVEQMVGVLPKGSIKAKLEAHK